jgi:two-component system nitrogen regulation response regulator NtrX
MARILIVDDDPGMRSVLSDFLRSEGYETLAARNGKIALKEISAFSPDLILLDINLPGMDGITLLEKLKEIDSRLIIIMITGHGNIRDAVKAIKLGAADYITKPFNNDDISTTIRNSLQGGQTGNNRQAFDLSLREKEVLNWLKKGKSSWDIATILHISERTVNYHVTNIMQKLNAVTRTQAVAVALEHKLINAE